MEFRYEVSAKVETLHLDSTIKHVLQGRITFHVPDTESAGEPLNLALVFPESAWKGIEVGDTLIFGSNQFWQAKETGNWYNSIQREVPA